MAAQDDYFAEEAAPAASLGALPETAASIVPADSIAGRALLAVIAIMTFLAALTLFFAQGLLGRDADPARLLAAVVVAGLSAALFCSLGAW